MRPHGPTLSGNGHFTIYPHGPMRPCLSRYRLGQKGPSCPGQFATDETAWAHIEWQWSFHDISTWAHKTLLKLLPIGSERPIVPWSICNRRDRMGPKLSGNGHLAIYPHGPMRPCLSRYR